MKRQQVAIRAQVRELQGDAVAALIGPVRMAQIAAVDPAPMFVSMVVAHEGVSRGEIVGLGARIKAWSRRVISRLSELLNPSGRQSAQIFDGGIMWHGNTSSRQACGEVVHARPVDQSGTLTSEAVNYIFPGEVRELVRSGARDVCSVEAEVELVETSGRHIVDEVLAATAVVLGDSRKQTPGFAGARVALITEFCPEGDDPPADPPAPPPPTPPPSPQLTREQAIEQAKALGVTAADFAPVAPSTAPAPPAPPTIPAPPERKDTAPATGVDLTSPVYNEFLPAE